MSNSQKPAYPHAIVIGLDCMTGLQTARILADRGVPVIALASNLDHPCCRTRVCERIIRTSTSSEELIASLQQLGPTLPHKAVLFPCADASVLLVSRFRERLQAWFHIMLPDADTLEMLMDKARFYTFARQHSLPIPATFFLRNRADAERAATQLSYPCILKPPIKTPQWERNTKAKVFKPKDANELLRTYEECSGWADQLMVQEWIEGTDANLFSCNTYFSAASEPLVAFTARKLRQWPTEVGTSSLGEECRNDVVLNQTIKLFQMVGLRGLGYLEMKRDVRSGRHLIIEPNIGRPTGRSAICEAGGVELLYTMYCDVLGMPLPRNREQKYTGVKWMYFRRDLQSAFQYWRRGELTLLEWWQSLRGPKVDALFSLKDPLPFLCDFLSAAGAMVKAKPVPPEQPQQLHELPQRLEVESSRFVDFDIHGIVGVRLVNASTSDAAAVRRQLGMQLERRLEREADIRIRFVDYLPISRLSYAELETSGYNEEGFFLVQAEKRRIAVRIPFQQIGRQGFEIMCESGLQSVPLLLDLINVYATLKGAVPLHASGFVHHGVGVLVTGWAKGGKTEALLAFAKHGARYVGDEWVLLSPEGDLMHGIPERVRLWDWHLAQLPRLDATIGRNEQMKFKCIKSVERAQQRLSKVVGRGFFMRQVQDAMPALKRQLNVQLQPTAIFGDHLLLTARPDKLFLMLSHSDPGIEVQRVSSTEIAARMAACVEYEQRRLFENLLAHNFAFPSLTSPVVEHLKATRGKQIERALAGKEAYVVRHPYPVSLEALYQAMFPFVTSGRRETEPAKPAEFAATEIGRIA